MENRVLAAVEGLSALRVPTELEPILNLLTNLEQSEHVQNSWLINSAVNREIITAQERETLVELTSPSQWHNNPPMVQLAIVIFLHRVRLFPIPSHR